MIFETHGHYDDEQFDTDRERLLEEFQRQDIRYVMNIGANIVTSKASVELAHRYDFIYAAIGTHPDDAPELSDAAIEMYRQMAADEKVKAIGEIGLDYFHEDVSKEVQIHWFRKQLELAGRTEASGCDPQQGCGKGYHGYHERDAGKTLRWRHSLFFIQYRDCKRIY